MTDTNAMTASRSEFAASPPAAQVAVKGGGPRLAFSRYEAEGAHPYVRTASRDAGGVWNDLTKAVGLVNDSVAELGRPGAGVDTIVDFVSLGSEMGAGVYAVDSLNAIVYVEYDPSWQGWEIETLGKSAAGAEAAVEMFLDLLPPPIDFEEQDIVRCTVWMKHPMGGASSRYSTLDRVPFADIAVNYPPAVRAELEAMCAMSSVPDDGRLALFHGPPGTGKTRFLFSLATEWSDWCDVHYVMDPDEMFSHSDYLTSILMNAERSDRWSILVMEDGDEFIDVGAKGKVGQGLSRLLNVADGFIGQAAKLMVLISTNVEHESFQPAAVRAGRCFKNLEFPAFTAAEAAEWLAAHDTAVEGEPETAFALDDDRAVTLADLYQMTR